MKSSFRKYNIEPGMILCVQRDTEYVYIHLLKHRGANKIIATSRQNKIN